MTISHIPNGAQRLATVIGAGRAHIAAAALAAAGFLASGTGAVHAQAAEDAFGTWLHPENGSHISIYQCGHGLCARLKPLAMTENRQNATAVMSRASACSEAVRRGFACFAGA